jgi:hypothetical protein
LPPLASTRIAVAVHIAPLPSYAEIKSSTHDLVPASCVHFEKAGEQKGEDKAGHLAFRSASVESRLEVCKKAKEEDS